MRFMLISCGTMPRLKLALLLVAALLASAYALRAAAAQSLFEGLAAGAKKIAESRALAVSPPPAPILSGLTHTASLVARSALPSQRFAPHAETGAEALNPAATARAYKRTMATPLGAALDALAARAAPRLAPSPPEATVAVRSWEGDTQPLALTDIAPVLAVVTAAGPAERTVAAPGDGLILTLAEVSGSTDVVARSAEDSETAEAAPSAVADASSQIDETLAAATLLDHALSSVGDEPASEAAPAPDAVPALGLAAALHVTAPVAAISSAPTAPELATAAPALPAEIERIMDDSDAVAAADAIPAEPQPPVRAERQVVASLDPGRSEALADTPGDEQVVARTVGPTTARARPAAQPRVKAEVAATRKPKPQRTAEAAAAATPQPQAAPQMPFQIQPQPVETDPPLAHHPAPEVRRPPRGLFQLGFQ